MSKKETFDNKFKEFKKQIKSKSPKEQNIETKEFFHNCLNKAINDSNKNLFRECVKRLGIEWNVNRTVPSGKFDAFASHLFENGEKIQKHEYKFWENACLIEKETKKKGKIITHAYSYESKVCFAINPAGYSLIYDSNVCMALLSLSKFDEVAKETTDNLGDRKEENRRKFFEKDYDLWEEGKELSENKK